MNETAEDTQTMVENRRQPEAIPLGKLWNKRPDAYTYSRSCLFALFTWGWFLFASPRFDVCHCGCFCVHMFSSHIVLANACSMRTAFDCRVLVVATRRFIIAKCNRQYNCEPKTMCKKKIIRWYVFCMFPFNPFVLCVRMHTSFSKFYTHLYNSWNPVKIPPIDTIPAPRPHFFAFPFSCKFVVPICVNMKRIISRYQSQIMVTFCFAP